MNFPCTLYTPDGATSLVVNNQAEFDSCMNGGWIDYQVAKSAPAPVEPESEPSDTPAPTKKKAK